MINHIASFLYSAKEPLIQENPAPDPNTMKANMATLIQKCFRGHQEAIFSF